MAADVGGGVGLDDHRHGVPADVALDPALHLPVAGERRLLLRRNRVDVRRVEAARQSAEAAAGEISRLDSALNFTSSLFQEKIVPLQLIQHWNQTVDASFQTFKSVAATHHEKSPVTSAIAKTLKLIKAFKKECTRAEEKKPANYQP